MVSDLFPAAADWPTAPLWRRFAALVYDSFILLAISLAYGGVITAVAAVMGEQPGHYQPMFNHWLFTLGWVFCLQGFYYGFWRKSGQTIGMRTWRIRLSDGSNPNVAAGRLQCLVRLLLTPVLVLLGGIGYWYRFVDPRGDCLQDKLSRTQVIVVPKNH
jgi:uncharacterized RDD family membrane protein YckC